MYGTMISPDGTEILECRRCHYEISGSRARLLEMIEEGWVRVTHPTPASRTATIEAQADLDSPAVQAALASVRALRLTEEIVCELYGDVIDVD